MTELDYRTTIRIPKELHKAARLKALELDITFSEAIRELLGMWVQGKIELPTRPKENEPPKHD